MALAAAGIRPMITCREALNVIQEFLDGELPPKDEARIRAHFDVCRRCYPKLRAEESFRSAVKMTLDGQHAPPRLKARVRALLAQESRG